MNWNVENQTTRMRLENWKAYGEDGGGALGNFVSHSFHYLEWLCGPITGLSARLSGLPDAPAMETNATISLAFHSGASGSLAMSCASYLGSGHRLEFYGEDGSLTLVNTTSDYMRGFELRLARRPATALAPVDVDDPSTRLRRRTAGSRRFPGSRPISSTPSSRPPGGRALPKAIAFRLLLDTARRAKKRAAGSTSSRKSMEKQA